MIGLPDFFTSGDRSVYLLENTWNLLKYEPSLHIRFSSDTSQGWRKGKSPATLEIRSNSTAVQTMSNIAMPSSQRWTDAIVDFVVIYWITSWWHRDHLSAFWLSPRTASTMFSKLAPWANNWLQIWQKKGSVRESKPEIDVRSNLQAAIFLVDENSSWIAS